MNISKLNDAQLYELCEKYGTAARLWRQKFAGLLPEVFKRKLYIKRGCGSIFEFAAKLAGMSEAQVRLVLNLEKKFEDKPNLKSLLINGEISVNKLVRVAAIATTENQEALAEQVKVLPKSALSTLARDEKILKSLPGQRFLQQNSENAINESELGLSEEVKKKLLKLKQKGIDINSLVLELLEKRDLEIAQEKEKLSSEIIHAESRYIPVKIKNILKKEFGNKCSIQTCTKQAATIHHTQRFSISHTHNPQFLAPLCYEHHLIAHSVDRKVFAYRRRE